MTDVRSRPSARYEPPTGDAPLDRVEQALVRMWIDIIAQEICEAAGGHHTDHHADHDDRLVHHGRERRSDGGGHDDGHGSDR